ncbi:MAG TPA: hypothetical protein VFD90_00425 [Gaiellales bacterium]|jgi:hypothetical protein|nr:hypothetical protein [Gaiellales bacterium]
MRRGISFPLATAERLPGHLRAGAVRLLVACLAIWGLGMLSPQIDRDRAIVVLIVGWGVILAGLLVFALGTQRMLARLDLPLVGAGVARAAVLLAALRRIGLVLLALAFFLFWTLIYIGVWRSHPDGAFRGLPHTPTFADFFYYAVSTAFVSPPGDIIAVSKGARTATMIELLTGTAALAAYLGSFLDFGPGGAAVVTQPAVEPPSGSTTGP